MYLLSGYHVPVCFVQDVKGKRVGKWASCITGEDVKGSASEESYLAISIKIKKA